MPLPSQDQQSTQQSNNGTPSWLLTIYIRKLRNVTVEVAHARLLVPWTCPHLWRLHILGPQTSASAATLGSGNYREVTWAN